MPLIAERYEPTGNAHWGGLGQVNECIDRHLGRLVMLKSVHRHSDMPRLLDERKALLKLRSRHVAQLLDIVTFPWQNVEITCLVIEYIAGANLATDYAPDANYQKTLWQIAAGLADIHEAGVIHRDVKPDNIRLDENGVVKIIDFGLSREVGVDDRTRSIIGTPAFMAPELYSDHTVALSPAVDVFAFGQTARAMLGSQLSDPRRTLSNFSEDHPALDAGIAGLLQSCIAPNPASRPAISAVADQIGRGLLRDRHRARIIDSAGRAYELHSSNRAAKIDSSSGSITVRYDGLKFSVTAISGSVFINNALKNVGDEMTSSCVITLGDGLTARRAFLTFDVSNPEVMP